MSKKVNDKTKELIQFRRWLNTLIRVQMENYLCDALWKGQLRHTDVYRRFLVDRKLEENKNEKP